MQRPWVTSEAYDAGIKVIIEARKAKALSQRDLADRLGKPRSFVSKIETKERRLDFVEFIVVARALDSKPGELIESIATFLPANIDF